MNDPKKNQIVIINFNFVKEIPLKMNDSKKVNSNNPLKFYKRNLFKNESDQKKKVHQKIEIAFKFTKEIPLKFIRTKKNYL